MKLYLLRHGDALDDRIDPARALSRQGRDEINAIAAFIASRLSAPATLYHSTKLRAEQSAEIVQQVAFPQAALEQLAGLNPNDDVAAMLEYLDHASDDLMLVGHLPHLGLLATRLIGARQHHQGIALESGGLLELQRHSTQWLLHSFVHPALVR